MDLGHFMTPGLSKDIIAMYGHTVLNSIVHREEGGFGPFHDTWSQYGHSVSCMTILF